MTVRELIAKLQSLPADWQDCRVTCETEASACADVWAVMKGDYPQINRREVHISGYVQDARDGRAA